jgi:hypothetical protein
MYNLLQGRERVELLWQEVPPFAVAFLIASVFFRFGSFALETLAFVGVWAVLAFVYAKALALFGVDEE